ncbi:hypothetical protein O181_036798 [Austropuccinia psidii MF-1]|uniref:GH18 domain-containing protein n=1 Tax=Austropuccinia psidii MF-1 TaxID=1389203 RepID=A0A9Q3DA53_9BASI|nr:hypothetical protein [Austropuccinia psidii MF-1]
MGKNHNFLGNLPVTLLIVFAFQSVYVQSNDASEDPSSTYLNISGSSTSLINSFEIKFGLSPENTTDGKNAKSGNGTLVAYYPAYNAEAKPVSDIKFELYDELVFFVATTNSNFTIGTGNVASWDALAKEFTSKSKAAGVRPIYSLGGWTGSRYLSLLVATHENRTRYAESVVDFAKKYGFEGFNLDWEYPSIQGIGCNTVDDSDAFNQQLFMKEVKKLWPQGSLSACVSIAGIRQFDYTPLPAANLTTFAQVLDKVHIMAYDVYGSFTKTTGPNAPLYGHCAEPGNQLSVQSGIDMALRQGFSPNQILLGIPAYAKTWTLASPKLTPKVVGNHTTYHYQNFTVIPPGGKFDDKPGKDICGQTTGWGGTWLVSELVENGILSEDQSSGGKGFTRYYDECSGEPFLVSNTTLISYDDINSTITKVEYAKSKNVSGIFFFDLLGPADDTVAAARNALLH